MYEIICDDALNWLAQQDNHSIFSFCTGVPDFEETTMELMDDYIAFFKNTVKLIFEKLSLNGHCIFIQTDRKFEGQLIDKSYIITSVAKEMNLKLIWHKIVLQRDVGKIDLHRPTFSHMLCYSYTGRPGIAFTDVIPVSTKIYKNATPELAVDKCIQYLLQFLKDTGSKNVIVDPFTGRGTVGIYAIRHGFDFIGVDIDKVQCDITIENLKPIRPNAELNADVAVAEITKKIKIKLNIPKDK
jgi:hypothetical protein